MSAKALIAIVRTAIETKSGVAFTSYATPYLLLIVMLGTGVGQIMYVLLVVVVVVYVLSVIW